MVSGMSASSMNTGRMRLRPSEARASSLTTFSDEAEFWKNGEDKYLAVADGCNNLLAPHGGALDAHLVDPHGDTGPAQALDEVEDAVAVL